MKNGPLPTGISNFLPVYDNAGRMPFSQYDLKKNRIKIAILGAKPIRNSVLIFFSIEIMKMFTLTPDSMTKQNLQV